MNDCINADIRDQLPDLLHDRLDASARAAVMAHLEACADCRDELRLLGEVRSMLEVRTPRVDLNYVIEALPKPPAPHARTAGVPGAPRRVWADWRIAAAVTLLIAGGSSVALLSRDHGSVQSPISPPAATSVAVAPQTPARADSPSTTRATAPSTAPSTTPAATEVAATTTAAEVTPSTAESAADANLSNLNQSQLKALLQDIDNLKAVPVAEPEPVSLRVNARTTGDDIL